MRVKDYLKHSVPSEGDAWAITAARLLDRHQQEVPVVVPVERCLRSEGLPSWSFAILVLDDTCPVKVMKEIWQRRPRYVLHVELPEDGLCIYSNLGKRFLKELQHRVLLGRADLGQWREEYHQVPAPVLPTADDLHRFLMNNDLTAGEREVSPTQATPYLRWASGGILPIANLEGQDWVVLFFRDIEPIGWNVGNGASETRAEFEDLNELLTREFAEELMLVDGKPDYTPNAAPRLRIHQFGFNPVGSGPLNADDRFIRHLAKHANLRSKDGIEFVLPADHEHHRAVHPKETRFSVEVNRAGQGRMTRCEDVLFSINPAESGIEVIRPYSFQMNNDEWLLDGEISPKGFLVRRPIMLLNLEFLRDVFGRTSNSLGTTINDDRKRLDCKILPGLPKDSFRLFYDPGERQARLADKRLFPGEAEQIEDWNRTYKETFIGLANTGEVADERLLSLCPVTWKSLELAFAHDVDLSSRRWTAGPSGAAKNQLPWIDLERGIRELQEGWAIGGTLGTNLHYSKRFLESAADFLADPESHFPTTPLLVCGSFGRLTATSGSDCDYLLVDMVPDSTFKEAVDRNWDLFRRFALWCGEYPVSVTRLDEIESETYRAKLDPTIGKFPNLSTLASLLADPNHQEVNNEVRTRKMAILLEAMPIRSSDHGRVGALRTRLLKAYHVDECGPWRLFGDMRTWRGQVEWNVGTPLEYVKFHFERQLVYAATVCAIGCLLADAKKSLVPIPAYLDVLSDPALLRLLRVRQYFPRTTGVVTQLLGRYNIAHERYGAPAQRAAQATLVDAELTRSATEFSQLLRDLQKIVATRVPLGVRPQFLTF